MAPASIFKNPSPKLETDWNAFLYAWGLSAMLQSQMEELAPGPPATGAPGLSPASLQKFGPAHPGLQGSASYYSSDPRPVCLSKPWFSPL